MHLTEIVISHHFQSQGFVYLIAGAHLGGLCEIVWDL